MRIRSTHGPSQLKLRIAKKSCQKVLQREKITKLIFEKLFPFGFVDSFRFSRLNFTTCSPFASYLR